MSNEGVYMPAANYEQPDRMAKEESGATVASPYMTLSFMALLVILHLMLSNKGLFDGDQFRLI
jgi:adenine deaminase